MPICFSADSAARLRWSVLGTLCKILCWSYSYGDIGCSDLVCFPWTLLFCCLVGIRSGNFMQSELIIVCEEKFG